MKGRWKIDPAATETSGSCGLEEVEDAELAQL
jgi:hypothetical protein